ncbi:hypothetical protein G7076_10245 [Sphingomonas sp. HDW15A]|uniref:PAS domain-containing protein n=1 Tax=Sphingomonas sp. HDW15A TaxID=2714942 RepID=UPI00140CA339|nr:hypothetical protein [Sphingomonas sp. HDW15A]QIK96764.1 hypothetical protein G7076_10245 [Sphingomonas sp. HDW15A]
MDGLSGFRSEYDDDAETWADESVGAAIGTDERRMHVRAYNYWVSLLDGRDYPSIEDLDPANITDFAPHSVLLDFTAGRDNPSTPYIGTAIREECGLGENVTQIEQVPSRSLLSRLTDHYLQIIANRAPIGFEAEFVNQRGHSICYRGILMPFSSDGDTIDFIYGVINWKDIGAPIAAEEPLSAAIETLSPESHIAWDDGPLAEAEAEPELEPAVEDDDVAIIVDEDAGLADRLWAARESAEICKAADGRSRVALYRALAMAYDFAVAAKRVPDDYAEILADAGVKAQARAPMTPVVKLVFGIDYDKARLTEFAAALSNAERNQVDFGEFQAYVEGQSGGLKALVAAERQARRPDRRPDDRVEKARAELRRREALEMKAILGDDEFVLVLSRRVIGGGTGYEPIALVEDSKIIDRAIRRAAK